MMNNNSTLSRQNSIVTQGQAAFAVIATGVKLWQLTLLRLLPLSILLVTVSACNLYNIHMIYLFGPTMAHDPLLNHWIGIGICCLAIISLIPTLYHQICFYAENQRPTYVSSFYFTLKYFHRFIIALVLMSLSIGLGIIALLIPGLIFAVIMEFYLPLMIMDKLSAFQAYKATCDLVWGHWWRSCLVLCLPTLLMFFVGYFIESCLYFFFQQQHISKTFLNQLITNASLSAFFLPLFFCLVVAQIIDLKKRQNDPASTADRLLSYIKESWDN